MKSMFESYTSLVGCYTNIEGDIEFANRIKELVRENYESADLYSTQDNIRELIINQKGIDFYEKYGDAINYIVENEYCNLERLKNPYLDARGYAGFLNRTCIF